MVVKTSADKWQGLRLTTSLLPPRIWVQLSNLARKHSRRADREPQESYTVPRSKTDGAPSITQQMNELSELVEQLEDPEIELEAALVLYEKGVQLSGSIQKTLESAEQRVTQVAADGSLLEESDSAGDA
jgi:exodeoxyribonuclease VII small subunit